MGTVSQTRRATTIPSLHERILGDIEGRILTGEWPPGVRIPFEHELSAQYQCSRMTVNKALSELAKAGLIERRRKVGSFVMRAPSRSAVLEIPDVKAEVAALGAAYRFETLTRRQRQRKPGRRGTPRGGRGGSDPRAHVPSLGREKAVLHRGASDQSHGDAGSGRREFRGNRSGSLAAGACALDAGRTPHSRPPRRCAPRRAARDRRGNRVPGHRTANLERRGGDHACQVHLPRRSARTGRPLLAFAKIGLGTHDWRCTGSHVRGVCRDEAGRTHGVEKSGDVGGDQQPPRQKMPRDNCTGQGDREDSGTSRTYLIRSRAWLQNCNS